MPKKSLIQFGLAALLVFLLAFGIYLSSHQNAMSPFTSSEAGSEEDALATRMPREPVVSPRTDGKLDSGDVIAGGVERPASDLASRETDPDADAEEAGDDPFAYGQTPPIKADANEQVAAAYEAIQTGKHPERLSVAVASATARSFDPEKFDPESDRYDQDYRAAYLRSPEPGRVWFPAQPAEGVSRIQALMPRYVEVSQGEGITLRVSGQRSAGPASDVYEF